MAREISQPADTIRDAVVLTRAPCCVCVNSAAQNRQTHEKVAIKHIDRVLADKADTIRIVRELRFLRLLKHPNIIAVHDVLLPTARTAFDSIYIVFELLDTDLSHLIRSKTKYDEVHIQVRRSERQWTHFFVHRCSPFGSLTRLRPSGRSGCFTSCSQAYGTYTQRECSIEISSRATF